MIRTRCCEIIQSCNLANKIIEILSVIIHLLLMLANLVVITELTGSYVRPKQPTIIAKLINELGWLSENAVVYKLLQMQYYYY